MNQIIVEDLAADFGEGDRSLKALENVSFVVERGQFVSVIGPSGCGKTTLLRILGNVLPATSGRVVCGQERGRAIVFQEDRLLPWRTILNNIAYGLEIQKCSKKERREIARTFVKLVGLSGFEDRYPFELSGGMKQRVNIARALAIDPDVLLMDEPFAALDAQTRELMQHELLVIWERAQRTVLFVTHQIEEAVFLSDRVIVFSGRPGHIKETIDVNISRPRDLSVKRSPEFVEIVDHIWTLLEADVKNAQPDDSARSPTDRSAPTAAQNGKRVEDAG
jgi:NitT/TauT family transport system ATP-binding protein